MARRLICRLSLCVLLSAMLANSQAAFSMYGIGQSINTLFKAAGVTIAGLTVVSAVSIFSIRGCMRAQALEKPDFLQTRDGMSAVNHNSHLSRYDVEKERPDVREYLEFAEAKDITLTLRLSDDASNSSIVNFVALDKDTVTVTSMSGETLRFVPITQVSGVAVYDPDSYGHYVVVNADHLQSIGGDSERPPFSYYFDNYHALVLASFSDNSSLLQILAAENDAVGEDGVGTWLTHDDNMLVVVKDLSAALK